MKIAIAARGVGEVSGGAKEYIISMLKNLPEAGSEHEFVFYYDDKQYIGEFSAANVTEKLIKSLPVFKYARKFIWDHLQLPIQILIDKPDVVFHPKNMMSVFNPRPTVVTVHDMMYYLPGLNAYRRGEMIYHQIMMTNSLKAATRIISVSKSTRRDICALVDHELGDKTFVVHEAAIERANADVNIREKYNLGTEKYIFFSGSLTPRKNLKRVIQAIGQVSKQIPHNFVITGGKKWLNTHVEETLRDTGIENRFIKLGYVPTEDLNLLYREADFYIHASTYEGFGLPVLEAFAQDCPVISSDNSSMPEVAGDAVIYIDPYSTQDIAEAILVAATDNTKRKEIVEKGREQFAKFSWEKAAKQTLEVLLAAASSN